LITSRCSTIAGGSIRILGMLVPIPYEQFALVA
jgi:hypothetical protein